MLLMFAVCACAPHGPFSSAGSGPAPPRVAEPGYQCRYVRHGDFGTISANFDIPRSGAPPRGSVRWEAPDQSQPLLFSSEWQLTRSRHFRREDGQARISAPLADDDVQSDYIDLYVRAGPEQRFTNPYTMNDSMLDGGGGLIHEAWTNLWHFNTGWSEIIAFGRRYPRFYLFAVRDLALNRPVMFARFEIDPAPFLRADQPVQMALDEVERMIATPALSCAAVPDLPPPPIIVT
jgi:hypothetical protein